MKMSLRKVLIILFCVGILFCGIGTGIAFKEYSSFEYLGQKNIGGNKTDTVILTEDLDKKEGNQRLSVIGVKVEKGNITLETSKKIPKDKIQFVVEYNASNVKDIHVNENRYDEYGCYENEPSWKEYYISSVVKDNNEIDQILRHKDEVLENIKQKQFYEYNYERIRSIKVVVHPSNKELIDLDCYW